MRVKDFLDVTKNDTSPYYVMIYTYGGNQAGMVSLTTEDIPAYLDSTQDYWTPYLDMKIESMNFYVPDEIYKTPKGTIWLEIFMKEGEHI